ncbi:dnaJ domain-containing protein [Ditylenchus destructor]|uniref:DnaJ domain-containing protein n=1 Tax=Ditylenchus destructor TaxID=166010 RepID=A0AAD4N3Z8_9BILA|nr:dnaJ domain-containing protein [Ditylenchus destructor]
MSSMQIAVYGFLQKQRVIEPAGLAYEVGLVKDKIALGKCTLPVFRQADASQLAQTDEVVNESCDEWMDKDDNKYQKYMSKLNPNEAKDQDHYKVLGLSKLRCDATMNQIKLAYRQKVLKYHPDKGSADLNGKRKEEIFSCIQKAYEQIGDTIEKRRAFDSVDPTFDETIPDSSEVNSKNFFEVLAPVFARYARFSNNQPVPLLGDANSSRDAVDHFYEFWFDFSSWREFSYLDSEDKSKGEDRYERREIEKMNKAEREKRRKKEMKRISTLIDITYEKDPRRQEEKRRKEEEARAEAEERQKAEEAERQAQLEEEKKANQAKQKKKKVMASQRKKLRDLCVAADYWAEENEKKHRVMEQIERICLPNAGAEFEEVSALCEKLENVKCYDDAMEHLKNCMRKDNKHESNHANSNTSGRINEASESSWSPADLQLLVKAVSLFPPGKGDRWRNVAEYVTNHSIANNGKARTEKEVIKQVKSLSAVDANSLSASQIKENGLLKTKNDISLPDTPSEALVDDWDADQQKQLENALKNTPASDPKRWEKIAVQVTGKTKKDCIKRYKKLAELVKQNQTKNAQ